MAAMAGWTLLGHVIFFLLLYRGSEGSVYWIWLLLFHVGARVVVRLLLLPQQRLDSNERGILLDLVVVWFADAVLLAQFCLPWQRTDPAQVVGVYPCWLAVRALMRVMEARQTWGFFYVLGLAYFLAAPLLPLAGLFAPLVYGAINGTGLASLAFVLRRLVRETDTVGVAGSSVRPQ
jgi:hypothetical protein